MNLLATNRLVVLIEMNEMRHQSRELLLGSGRSNMFSMKHTHPPVEPAPSTHRMPTNGRLPCERWVVGHLLCHGDFLVFSAFFPAVEQVVQWVQCSLKCP